MSEVLEPRHTRASSVAAGRAAGVVLDEPSHDHESGHDHETGDPDAPHSGDRRGHRKRRTHFWLRWAHVYISMFSLLVMLFFGITGITLNHPSWTFGDEATTSVFTGTLPADTVADGEVEFLVASEFLRATHDVGGEVSDFGQSGDEATISYEAPGYSAEVFFDVATLEYDLTVQQEGFVGVMNDLHKGRDASSLWKAVVDISGGLLVAIALTGLGIQFFLRKRRVSALGLSIVGALLTVILILVTIA